MLRSMPACKGVELDNCKNDVRGCGNSRQDCKQHLARAGSGGASAGTVAVTYGLIMPYSGSITHWMSFHNFWSPEIILCS